MTVTTQKKLIHLRFRNMGKHFAAMGGQMGMEDVHRFRVEVKKLRAFLRLISLAADKPIKIPHGLKRLYRSAGILRDLQVHRLTMQGPRKHISPSNAYTDHVDQEIEKAEKDLKGLMKEKSLSGARKKIAAQITGKVTPAMIREFHQEKISAIHAISFAGPLSDENLHTIRKNIKDILYNARTFETDLHKPFPLPGWNRKRELHFIKLAEQLGHFQDYSVELLQLRKSKKKMNLQEKKLAGTVLHKKAAVRMSISQLLKVPIDKTGEILVR